MRAPAADEDEVDGVPRFGYACGMVGTAKKHVDELLKLSPDERSEAAELLLRSLEDEAEVEDGVSTAWASEIERRVDRNEPGISAETVFAEARARLQKRS